MIHPRPALIDVVPVSLQADKKKSFQSLKVRRYYSMQRQRAFKAWQVYDKELAFNMAIA